MTTPATPVTVEVSHTFDASAETVFDAWLAPPLAREFLFATDTGSMVRCDIEPYVGGGFTVIEKRPRDDGQPGTHEVEHVGRYLDIDPPLRLVFSFAVPQYSAGETTVTLEFNYHSPGGCELTLTHELGDSPAAHENRDRTREGWLAILARLEAALADDSNFAGLA